MKKTEAENFRRKIELASAWTDDNDALECIELFPKWGKRIGTDVITGERMQHNGALYKCIQPHHIQADWTPDKTPALWVKVSVEEWPAWLQPQGGADAYMKGDKVSHNGKHWVSGIDNNVWEPGVYGWGEV